jgi:cytochrome c-type biogenesis protein CcsB
MTDQGLAQISNVLVYSALLVYVGAVAAFVLDLARAGEAAGARAREQRPLATTAGRVTTAAAGSRTTGTGTTGAGTTGTALADRPTGAGSAVPDAPRRAAGVATSLTWLALLLHVGGVVARGLSAHRVPWGNMYEFAVTGSAVVTLVFLLTALRRDVRYLGAFVIGPVLLTVLTAVLTLYTESAPLVPALNSYWLVIHVSVAFVSSALFTVAFSVNLLQLVQERRELRGAAGSGRGGGRFMDALPGSRELDATAYRLIAVSFPLWTFTLVAGAIWAEVSWGRYWNWDPKEVWTFVIWVVYAAYLHARATGGWSGRRAASLAIAGYACVLVNFGVVNVFFPGNHSYAGIG